MQQEVISHKKWLIIADPNEHFWIRIMKQAPTKTCGMLFWGSIFSLFFLYAYGLSFAIAFLPTPGSESLYHPRFSYGAWFSLVSGFRGALISLSFPSYAISINVAPADPYFSEAIYFPLLAGFQWFLYGCILGWYRFRIKLRKFAKHGV